MPLASEGPAPYAPPASIIALLDAFRHRGLPTPVTADVLTRAGTPESLLARVTATLKQLELINDAGEPTAHVADMRKAASDKYTERVAAWIRDVYGEVFNFTDPATDPYDKVEDAFRTFTPHGQRGRMVTLFLGLCEYAGMLPDDAPARQGTGGRPRGTTPRPARRPAQAPKASNATPQKQKQNPPPPPRQDVPPPPQDGLHPFVAGLLATLPPVGSSWSQADREKWTQAALAVFDLIYTLAPETIEGGGDD